MAGTILFKNTTDNAHRTRYLTNVDDFSQGMKYTDAPLATGNAKAIVNYALKNDGECLVPRGGFKTLQSNVATLSGTGSDYCVHHATSMYISAADESDATLCNYLLAGNIIDGGMDLTTAKLVISQNNGYITGTYTEGDDAITGVLLMKPAIKEMHGLSIASPVYRDGIYTSLEGNTYVLVHTSEANVLGVLKATYNTDKTEVTWYIKQVTPTEVQPTQAINYGYNMFKDNPYTFANTVSATGYVQLTGVIPYDESGKLLLTARPGTPITFELFYKYPQTDADNEDKYYVQWEAQDLNSTSDAEVLQKFRNSAEYTPGDSIKFSYTPSYTAFSLIIRVYKKSELADQDAAWEASTALQALTTKDEYATPTQVTTLASYYLTSNSSSTALNLDAVSYDLGTATGMCTWQQRLVMWGVQGAKSTLFVSEVNDPGYMPYPNNSEVFADDIVGAVPYLTNLLVFTRTSLYKLVLADDGLSYTTTCVQEKLNMSEADGNTITTVQNMVYFKSGNYFYMVVPNTSSTTQDTQLAPVTRPVEFMFNDFTKTMRELISQVYNFSLDDIQTDIVLNLQDFYVYLANTQIRNVYKIEVSQVRFKGDTQKFNIDIMINYDTVLRAWTVYMIQASKYRLSVFIPTVTGEAVYCGLHSTDSGAGLEFVEVTTEDPKDDFTIDMTRTLGNYQYIDTGNRDFNEDLKKRFREVQFMINNTEGGNYLVFNTGFKVDDQDVVPMYKYETSYCTDKTDPNYGALFIERVPLDGVGLPDMTQLDSWTLDASMFPDITVHKVRYKVSGKGYNGSVQLLCKSEVYYELLHVNWIYRVMFAR